MTTLIWSSFEAVLFAFLEERFPADTENVGGAGDAIARGFERGRDGLALDLLQGSELGKRHGNAGNSGANGFREILRLECIRRGENKGAFDGDRKSTRLNSSHVAISYA